MRVRGAICRQCAVFVYVRTKNDVRACPGRHMVVGAPPKRTAFEHVSVFGDLDYPAIGTPGDGFHRALGCVLPMATFVPASGEVRADTNTLFYDWNNHIDKFGIIPAPAYRDFDVAVLPAEPPDYDNAGGR
jgi:hypothetical protein